MDTPRIVSLPLPRMVSRTSSRLRMGGSGEGEDGGEGICEGKRMCERSLRVDCEVVRRRSSTGRRCKDHRPWPRPRSGVQFSLFAALLVLSVCALQLVAAQSTGTGTRTSAGGSAIASASTSASAVDATSTVATLTDSTLTRTQLDVGSSVGATFHLDTTSDEPVYISISLCSGPEIPAYDASNKNLQLSMGMSSAELRRATLFRLYVSDDPLNMSPGPDNLPDEKANVVYAIGGWAGVTLDQAPLGAWIAVWPPEDVRGVSGTYEVQVGASSTASIQTLANTQGLSLDDTDPSRALLTSFNYTSPGPNLTAIVLPTSGEGSLPSPYLNSSFCAIFDAWSALSASENGKAISLKKSETTRGVLSQNVSDGVRRMQFEVDGLQKSTNYTAWLLQGSDIAGGGGGVLWPAVKFLTKTNDNCRLVYDVPFCPEVAYSIPLSPTISQSDALDVIKQTISPNYANFSNTVDTFPCGDPEFGMYSYVATCEDCKNSYRNWLCAVAMPRCTDPISSTFQSAASQNGSDLTGADTPPNTAALPYIVNRNNDSRQTYIDQDLQPGAYGELLPCTSTCYFVSRACPPVVQWGCPQWDITAQRDYGAFVDADSDGNGGGANGGAGPLGQRWGGVQRFVATDGFGNQYCNALGTDLALRQQNAAPSVRGSPGTLMVWIMPFVAALAVALS